MIGEGGSDLSAKLGAMARFSLAHLPTPLEAARGLESAAAHVRLFIKRDDCTGLALGGNKSRKLEFTLGAALEQGASVLVTASSLQSNHIRQTAAAAASAGLDFHAVVAPALDHFPSLHLESGNMLLSGGFGATFHVAPDETALDSLAAEVVEALARKGERPYFIPLGASDGIGSLGYVACALEILGQCASAGIAPRAIFTATGSCGTQAGLLAGFRLSGARIPVIGISVSEPAEVKCAKIRACLTDIGKTLGETIPVSDGEIVVHDAYVGEGYSRPTAAATHWIRALARSDGILLDPVYTGKAFAGMADILGTPAFAGSGDIIFLHTGGVPALFADPCALWRPDRNDPEFAALSARETAPGAASRYDDEGQKRGE